MNPDPAKAKKMLDMTSTSVEREVEAFKMGRLVEEIFKDCCSAAEVWSDVGTQSGAVHAARLTTVLLAAILPLNRSPHGGREEAWVVLSITISGTQF
jgi:hypothetical protein